MKVKGKWRENWLGISLLLIAVFIGSLFIYAGFTTMLEAGPVADASPPLSRERLGASVAFFGGLAVGATGIVMTAGGIAILTLTIRDIISPKKKLL